MLVRILNSCLNCSNWQNSLRRILSWHNSPSSDTGSSSSAARKSLSVALFYGICSLSMNFLNKAVVTSYEFNYPYVIMICQMVVTIIFLELARFLNYVELPQYNLNDGRKFFPASFCFALHSTLSLSALSGMNIPMYTALKRCTPMVSLVLSVLILKKSWPSRLIVISVLVITFGCLIAGISDFDFDATAYEFGLSSVLAQGGYLTLVQKSSEEKKSTLEMIHINGYNTLPFFVFMSMVTGQMGAFQSSKYFHDSDFQALLLILVLYGSLLTYSQFLCASVCSALTASLVGVAKSAAQTVVGLFVFGGVHFNPLNAIGLALNLLGGIMYTFVKYKETKQNKASNRSSSRQYIQEAPLLPVTASGLDFDNQKQSPERSVSKSPAASELSQTSSDSFEILESPAINFEAKYKTRIAKTHIV